MILNGVKNEIFSICHLIDFLKNLKFVLSIYVIIKNIALFFMEEITETIDFLE